ncbi:hypothetical protein HNR73_007665 [Phytomonospora endophytica]|uniref:Uncharacterized protein n=1 Tax=Phytomonospora endophytica TaxID=714109 RepID=A0A841G294_9ACTN|nr:hypothetical protein [Phytomonospora endophytica]
MPPARRHALHDVPVGPPDRHVLASNAFYFSPYALIVVWTEV